MTAPAVPTCAHCKTAPAALLIIFTTADQRGVALPYCQRDAFEVAPVLVAAGYEITLAPATTPPWLLLCEYGADDCARPAQRGYRMCPDHLQTVEEVFDAGKSSGASVARLGEHPSRHPQDAFGQTMLGDTSWIPRERTRGGYDR